MDGRVAQLDCTVRVSGAPVVAQSIAERLKHVARDNVIATYASALDALLEDDPHVYVLREVDCPINLVTGSNTTDADLAYRWGEGLAGGVARAIERADANCVAFADQADYVASFAADMLRGVAWDRWFYASFGALRDRPVPDALRAVLQENHERLPEILAALNRRHALEGVLDAVGPAGSADLWAQGFLPPAVGDGEGQLFYASALGLIDDLALWKGPRPGPAVLRTYLSRRPPAADWRDRRSLAQGLLDVVRFLGSQGHLRSVDRDSPQLSQRLTRALAKLDWLDAEWLQDRLIEEESPIVGQLAGLPARPAGIGSRAKQRALLEDLEAVLQEQGDLLDRSRPTSAANALRLHAWLSDRDPAWRRDPFVAPMIERVLGALEFGAGPSTAFGAWAREADLSAWLRALPEVGRPEGTAVVETAIAGRTSESWPRTHTDASDRGRSRVASGCAGVWLLTRAVIDARLPEVLATTVYPSSTLSPTERLQAILLAIALRWSGPAAIENGDIDPGLRLLVGQAASGTPRTIAQLRDRWAPDDRDDADGDDPQLALLRILLGQRLVGGSALYLHLLSLGGGVQALIAGDQSAGVWPLGCVIRSPRDATEAIGRWRSAWSEATGRKPGLVGDGSVARLIERAGTESITKPRRGSEEAARHRANRERLQAAMATLNTNQLDRPSDDLVIALIAITMLRVWARWLRQFNDSSVPYLLENFIRRPGWITVGPESTVVELAPQPLDIVVQMSGYATEIEGVPWLEGRHVQFSMPA